jgi:hypothetical protein
MIKYFVNLKAFLLQKRLFLLYFVPLVVDCGRLAVVSLQFFHEFRADVADFLSLDDFFQLVLLLAPSLGFPFLGLHMTGHVPS